jgi:hypothetical protein
MEQKRMVEMTNNQLFFCGVLAIVSMCASCHTARYNESNWQERMIKNHHPYYFYNALYRDDVELVKRFLEAGSDPNYCKGENGWVDSNPLKVLAEGFHNTYNYRDQAPKANANQAPDVAILYLLIDSGADINKLPYIWDRINRFTSKSFIRIKEQRVLRLLPKITTTHNFGIML